jgi:putative transposase
MTKERLQKIKELEQEVDLLKQLLAEKELESKLKDDLLKKKYPKVKRKYS